MALLAELSSSPEVLDLTAAVIKDVIEGRKQNKRNSERGLRQQLSEVSAKKYLLVNAFVYKQQIDKDMFKRQSDAWSWK